MIIYNNNSKVTNYTLPSIYWKPCYRCYYLRDINKQPLNIKLNDN